MKSATVRYCNYCIISHEICNREILQLLCNISWNLRPLDIGFWAYTSTNTIYWILVKHLTFNPDIFNQTYQNQIWPWDIHSDHFKSNIKLSTMRYHTHFNQISHKTFNNEIFNQTNLNRISHKTFNCEIFNNKIIRLFNRI